MDLDYIKGSYDLMEDEEERRRMEEVRRRRREREEEGWMREEEGRREGEPIESWRVKEEWRKEETGQTEEEGWREDGERSREEGGGRMKERERSEEQKEVKESIEDFDVEAQPLPNYLIEPLFLVEAEIEKKRTHDIKELREDDPYIISILLENNNYIEHPHHVTM